MGPLIDQSAIDDYLLALEKVKAEGGKILYGGLVIDKEGFFVMPTIVCAENHYRIVQEETFAPILYLITFDDLEDAEYQKSGWPQN